MCCASDKIVVLYSPPLGLYPWLHDDGTAVNGGLPQLVAQNQTLLRRHLEKWERDLAGMIPDPAFAGIAAIDWESWFPIWPWNGASSIYQVQSRALVAKLHPQWTAAKVEAEAKSQFESGAKTLMLETLSRSKQLRPRAQFGY